MSRAARLTSTADFRRVYAQGRRVALPSVVVHVLAGEEQRPARVGVSAGRGLGGAVQRNRVKRRLREAIRPLHETLPAGADMVFVGTTRTVSQDFQELADSVRNALAKAGGLVG